jgi:hypothetical protein
MPAPCMLWLCRRPGDSIDDQSDWIGPTGLIENQANARRLSLSHTHNHTCPLSLSACAGHLSFHPPQGYDSTVITIVKPGGGEGGGSSGGAGSGGEGGTSTGTSKSKSKSKSSAVVVEDGVTIEVRG